jgi:hypothetical protein
MLVSFTVKLGIFSERETIIILFGNKPWYWFPPYVDGGLGPLLFVCRHKLNHF